MIKVSLCFVLLYFLFAVNVLARDDELKPEQWLANMRHAVKVLNYHGTVAFLRNGRLDTMKYFHTTVEELEQERLLSINSPMREVIRDAGKISCVFKDTKKVVVNHRPVSQSFIIDLPVDFSELNNVYQYAVHDQESVAMHLTRIISIDAKDKYRYGRKVWIDEKNFLPLKVEVYDLSGKTIEQVVFSDLQIDSNLASVNADKKIENAKVENIYQTESLPVDSADFVLENIPPAFNTVFFTRMKIDKLDQSVDHLLLSDGFSSISVYRELKADDVQLGLQTLGSVNSFTRIIENFQITAMGEVPAKAVRFIAQGIKFR